MEINEIKSEMMSDLKTLQREYNFSKLSDPEYNKFIKLFEDKGYTIYFDQISKKPIKLSIEVM